MADQEQGIAHKVVMLGDSGVGKTSIVLQLMEHVFRRLTSPTVGSGCFHKEITTTKGPIGLNVWDTAGEERYRSFTGLYSQGAVAAVVVFDLTDEATFQSLGTWVDTFKETADADHHIWVCGNKLDLDGRVVAKQTAESWCSQNGYKYFDVSAKTGENVDLVFADIAETVAGIAAGKVVAMQLPEEGKQEKGCC
jgi:small GTP-binding protein